MLALERMNILKSYFSNLHGLKVELLKYFAKGMFQFVGVFQTALEFEFFLKHLHGCYIGYVGSNCKRIGGSTNLAFKIQPRLNDFNLRIGLRINKFLKSLPPFNAFNFFVYNNFSQ